MHLWDSCWQNINLATFASSHSFGIIENAVLGIKDGKIAWCGKASELSVPVKDLAEKIFDGQGCWFIPGFIDCHTHLVYAGNRAKEFDMRLRGVSYEDIAKNGGGILTTVSCTRDATEEELFIQSLPRVKALLAEGVTTIEIKSGYGLNLKDEIKQLQVARKYQQLLPVNILTTYLGAHTLSPNYNDIDVYTDTICKDILPVIAKENLADAVDAYCERIAFSPKQIERIFDVALSYNLPVKLHADQLSDNNAAMLAANYKAISADHLEYANERGIAAMASAGTVAVLLPGAFYYLKEKTLPPIATLRQYNVPIAIATDCNPGSSPIASIRLILNMACILFGLTPLEALLGVTKHAAQALGISHLYGSLVSGKVADIAAWHISHPRELAYSLGENRLAFVLKNGKVITPKSDLNGMKEC